MLIILFLLLTTEELFYPDKILQFADFLYDKENYTSAYDEYQRYLFLSDSTSDELYEKIIDCLIYTARYDEAENNCQFLKNDTKRTFIKGKIFFYAGIFDSARSYLEKVKLPYKESTKYLIGLSYAHEYKFVQAGKYLKLPENFPHYKKVALGALFALLPGGGHLYCKRWGDAVFSFLVISGGTGLSYYYHSRDQDLKFSLALTTTLIFYLGNIYGGINAVRNYNYYQNEKYLKAIEQTLVKQGILIPQ